MLKYLELKTNIQINHNNDFTNLYKGDILITDTNYFTKEDSIVGGIYVVAHYNSVEYIKVSCDESSRFIIDKHNFQNDSTLLYMLINMYMVTDITTQYVRNRLIDEVLSI